MLTNNKTIIYAVFDKIEINTLSFTGLDIKFIESFYKKENAELKSKDCTSPEIVEIILPTGDEYGTTNSTPSWQSCLCEYHLGNPKLGFCSIEPKINFLEKMLNIMMKTIT